MTDISPFTQTPKLPGVTVSAGPLVWLCGIALALSTAGLAGLRRRDIGDLGPTSLIRPGHDWLVDYIRESSGTISAGRCTRRGTATQKQLTQHAITVAGSHLQNRLICAIRPFKARAPTAAPIRQGGPRPRT